MARLTFIESAEDMPAHIAATSPEDAPRIPMALASEEHDRQFWRILLHIVVPGTMLALCLAALLAALSIRLGIQPLHEAAVREMLFWRDKWNNIEIPETWSVNCLSLLLDADKEYRSKAHSTQESAAEQDLLMDKDRMIFERLVDYKMLEMNLTITLTAKVGWTPKQTTIPIGTIVIFKGCAYPRSVTIMGPAGKCGLCLGAYDDHDHEDKSKTTRVSTSDSEDSNAVWYECAMQDCRAQYVAYNVEAPKVRPECHYCRTQGTVSEEEKEKDEFQAPTVECTKCLSRIIWPIEYRSDEKLHDWVCMACIANISTIVHVETTANQLRDQNGQDWLLENSILSEPFNNRTLFHTISNAMQLDDLCDRLQILPMRDVEDLHLYFQGKLIRNSYALLDRLLSGVSRRRTEAGTCSLCFTSGIRKTDLHFACERSGCHQCICKGYLEWWYGLNASGRIINTAALGCPFCRRIPTAKTLASYGMGIHAVGGLKDAVDRSGEYISAWCARCGYAKSYMERVCAAGAPPAIERWVCDGCRGGRKTSSSSSVQAKILPCPGCGIETQKSTGCDHIQCVIPTCRVHWCFFCGEKQDQDKIYNHMSTEHGGYYNGRDYESDDGWDSYQ